MKGFLIIALFFASATLSGQYEFSGQVSEPYANSYVYLSLVEDYRRTSRVYLNQVIQSTKANAEGHFTFKGNDLPAKNRVYRIHVDGCTEQNSPKNHFLRECATTESLLFIASNQDTLSLPLRSNQAFCDIQSTNSSSSHLLKMEALKEEMIVDFMDGTTTKTAQSLKFEKWFKRFQEFALETKEPLVQLAVFDFLSDRKNETYDYYLADIKTNDYYANLLENLKQEYPSTLFTTAFTKEYSVIKPSLSAEQNSELFSFNYIKYLLLLLVATPILLLILKQKKSSNKKLPTEQLTNQETKIFDLIKSGKTNKEIATVLFISHSTVKTHVNNIYKKLDITTRNELRSKF